MSPRPIYYKIGTSEFNTRENNYLLYSEGNASSLPEIMPSVLSFFQSLPEIFPGKTLYRIRATRRYEGDTIPITSTVYNLEVFFANLNRSPNPESIEFNFVFNSSDLEGGARRVLVSMRRSKKKIRNMAPKKKIINSRRSRKAGPRRKI